MLNASRDLLRSSRGPSRRPPAGGNLLSPDPITRPSHVAAFAGGRPPPACPAATQRKVESQPACVTPSGRPSLTCQVRPTPSLTAPPCTGVTVATVDFPLCNYFITMSGREMSTSMGPSTWTHSPACYDEGSQSIFPERITASQHRALGRQDAAHTEQKPLLSTRTLCWRLDDFAACSRLGLWENSVASYTVLPLTGVFSLIFA